MKKHDYNNYTVLRINKYALLQNASCDLYRKVHITDNLKRSKSTALKLGQSF